MATERMRWWGWGAALHPQGLPPHALRFLRETVGIAARPRPPVALEHVKLAPSSISPNMLAGLREILGEEHVRQDHGDRVLHAAGKSYPDLVRLRAGRPSGAPDAVLYPSTREQLRALLNLCARESLAVVPFGGGTSVVGGVEPLRGTHRAVVALDTGRLTSVLGLDEGSRMVTVQAGARARELEDWLSARGLTLGHFPQSFEYVSLGGCAATRSAGQASSGYGRFERMVQGLHMVAPAGDMDLGAFPASAAGPGVRELAVGSEGTLGVIDELTLRVRRAPAARIYEGVFFESFAAGIHAFRELAQNRCTPEVARLSDERETRMSLALAGSGGAKGRLGRAYLDVRGYGGGCLAILGFEGDPAELGVRRAGAIEIVRAAGGLRVGRSPGRAWLDSRFSAPYLRDELLTQGVLVETLETATRWSNVRQLHRRVAEAIEGALGAPSLVMCHVSHLYETGASLYFTFIAAQRKGEEIEQWQAAKAAASAAIVDGGGTITHHHAVGRDHAPWMEQEIGSAGVSVLRALKAELDPAGIMNPGKLLS
ncbi:MAG TPA: FAD-binding oxidoreductase [Solirubrobacteraceae bacterium]|nr:FAD-binding oxidoreductase [Solirubrobacteraceae bacterium]